ncbi:unnamed protein product [Ambrosiozyma monospora]|uniref:Unnamed protein product n=1 Tax=Ambrosiozyma monospora TaxID=43982 RepID=A0A9W7DG56_AMBMO|nr:unnamed protein product [Ambrosiozyma monospora]
MARFYQRYLNDLSQHVHQSEQQHDQLSCQRESTQLEQSENAAVLKQTNIIEIANVQDSESTIQRKRKLSLPQSLPTQQSKSSSRTSLTDELDELVVPDAIIQDTIGVCFIDTDTNTIITGCSSGGNLLKDHGRVGCSGVIGSGLFTYTYQKGDDHSNGNQNDTIQISVMCSGNGEDIIQMNLAREVCNNIIETHYSTSSSSTETSSSLSHKPISQTVSEFIISKLSKNVSLRALDSQFNEKLYVGVIGYVFDSELKERLVFYFHSTETFAFGVLNGCRGDENVEFELSCLEQRQGKQKGYKFGEWLL